MNRSELRRAWLAPITPEGPSEYVRSLHRARAHLPLDHYFAPNLAACRALRDLPKLLAEPRFVRMLEYELGADTDGFYDECSEPDHYRHMAEALNHISTSHRFSGHFWNN